ncbi:MAG TPA: hypothetical protein VKI44_07455 [Acetobacteraceae bacterium]|nr:hypothetical protein [Acetobacteraceae bacterium]
MVEDCQQQRLTMPPGTAFMITGTGVHDRPDSVFRINWSGCSRSNGIRVHDRPERADITPTHPASLGKEIDRAGEEGYTLAVIDTAPHADHSALQAARAADLVVIPCRPATFDIAAIGATLDLCKLANKQAVVVLN